MNRRCHFTVASALFGLLLIAGDGLAQGSTGGSLGNDNKSLSGGSGNERPSTGAARRAKPEARDVPRRASRGGGGFDGVWVVRASGQSAVCPGQTSSNTVIVSGGRISGNNVRSGSVSANGAVYATGGGNGLTNITTGRLSGASGSGTFRQSDGCTGRWAATKQ